MNSATIENLNHECSSQEPSQSRRMKVILPQCYAALAIFAVNLSHMILERATYLVALSMNIESPLLGWYRLATWIGLLIGGTVAQIIGGRTILLLAGATSTVGWVTLVWISPNAVMQWMFYIVGLTRRMMLAPAYVYLAEISQPNMRNAIMATMYLSSLIGSVCLNQLGPSLSDIVSFVNVVFALFGVVLMFFLPESPYWLANKGRSHAVETSLAWFRGRTNVENVKSESKAIISNAQNSPTVWKSFGQKSLRTAALIVGFVFLANAFVRIFIETFYSFNARAMLSSGNYEWTNLGSLVVQIFAVLLSIAFVVLVSVIGKRIIMLISLFTGSVALVVACIFNNLNVYNVISMDVYHQVLQICLVVAYFSIIAGIEPVPLLLNGELFPSKLRYFGAGFGFFMMNVCSNNFEIYDFISEFGTLFLALASMVGFISLLWLFPKNENESLVEIERSLTSSNESRRQK